MTDADWEALEAQGPPLPDPLAELYERERSEARLVEEIPPGPEGVSDDLRDEAPAHGQRDWARAAPGAAPPRVTQAIRREVAAKIGIPLAITGALYKLRDPWCGSVFEDIRKDLGAELADLACESPSVLAFFMGAGGRYMKYLNIGFTLLPWLEMIAAHHVLHTVGKDAKGQDAAPGQPGGPLQPPPPDFARYPA